MELKFVRMDCMFVWAKSKIRRMSLTLTEAVDDHAFLVRCAMCEVSMHCKKISEKIPEDGAPTASLSY